MNMNTHCAFLDAEGVTSKGAQERPPGQDNLDYPDVANELQLRTSTCVPCADGCTAVHHKGSSARLRRATCKKCKKVTQEERTATYADPAGCLHAHEDHRGSDRLSRKTFCLDCGTVIATVPQELHKEAEWLKDSFRDVGLDDAMLLSKVMTGAHLDVAIASKASALIAEESKRMEDGNYRFAAILNTFAHSLRRSSTTSSHMDQRAGRPDPPQA